MISRYGSLCLVTLLSTICTPAQAAAQNSSRVGGGLTLGLTPNLAEGFSNDQICRKRSAISGAARATFALTNILQLEALGEVFVGPPTDCVDGLIPPPPPSGPHAIIVDYYDDRLTNPPTVLSPRFGGSLPQADNLTLRPYVGVARFNGKRITAPQAGISILQADVNAASCSRSKAGG